jgi:DNA primase
VKGSVEREAYRQRLARLLRVDERALLRSSSGRPPRRRRSYQPLVDVPPLSQSTGSASHRLLEERCIKALLFDPTLIHFIDRTFRASELACLHQEDFNQTDFREIFKLVKEAHDQDAENPIDYVQQHSLDHAAEELYDLQEADAYPDWRFQPKSKILESLIKDFINLRRIRIGERLDQLTFLNDLEEQSLENMDIEFQKLAMELAQVRIKLDKILQ